MIIVSWITDSGRGITINGRGIACMHDIDDAVQLGSLIQSAMGESSCSAEEYVAGEDAIPVCADFDCEDWDENWLNSLNVDNPNQFWYWGSRLWSTTATTQINMFNLSKLLKLWRMYKHSWNTEAMLSKQHL